MRTLLIGALAATLVGCNCLLPPQAAMESCTDANRFSCFDRAAASQPIEPEPASFQFRDNGNQVHGRGGDRKAVVCSRPREGPSHRGEVRHDRRASRAFSISHLTLASFMEEPTAARK